MQKKIWLSLQQYFTRNSTNLTNTTSKLPQTPESNKNVDTTPRGMQRKPKRIKGLHISQGKDVAVYNKLKRVERCSTSSSSKSDWLQTRVEEIDEQELEAHYSYMAKIQEVPNADSCTDAEPLEQWNGVIVNVIRSPEIMCDNDIQA
ncbi:hypothetical protein Tco_1193842 [Tanacetum coccineum]